MTDYFEGSKITADGNCSHEIKRCLLPGRKAMRNLDSILKSRHYFANKGPYSQSYGFSSSHVWTWRLDHKEGWTQKNWCLRILVLEKILQGPWTKEIKPGNTKGNQPCIFIGRTDTEAEALILWSPDAKSWLFRKDSDSGKIEGKRRNRQQRMRWLHSITNSVNTNLNRLSDIVEDRGAWHATVHGVAKSWT